MSGYPAAVREALIRNGIDGWTEYETHGSWRGKREAGTTFEFYRAQPDPDPDFAELVGIIGREAMPDQDAIQVTRDEHTTTLWEA
jgi:hypothetical protein